jgi:hypothetical protein
MFEHDNADVLQLNIYSLSFPDFLEQHQVSIRLRNCINQAVDEGGFPFQTIGDYLDAGDAGVALLMQLPNLGRKAAKELNEVIAESRVSRISRVPTANFLDDDNSNSIRSLSFRDFLEQRQAPRRLRNCINRGVDEGHFPFQTVGDYLSAGDAGVALLMEVPNLGRKTVKELNEVIEEALVSGIFRVPSVNTLDADNISPIRFLSFPALLDRCHASVRVRNGLIKGISEGLFPYDSVGDYVDGGKKATTQLMHIPNIGKGAARELHNFIEGVLGKRLELANQLEAKYPRVFDDVLATYRRTPDTESLTFHQIEKQIQQLLDAPRHAEICQRRFNGDTLAAIASDLGVTRERVRQIESKYDSLITNIYTESWTAQAVASLLTQQATPDRLPHNEALSAYHRNLPAALRKVFLPGSGRHGSLHTQERYQLAIKLGFDADAELWAWTAAATAASP